MEHFPKTANGFQPLTAFKKTLHLRCLTVLNTPVLMFDKTLGPALLFAQFSYRLINLLIVIILSLHDGFIFISYFFTDLYVSCAS